MPLSTSKESIEFRKKLRERDEELLRTNPDPGEIIIRMDTTCGKKTFKIRPEKPFRLEDYD